MASALYESTSIVDALANAGGGRLTPRSAIRRTTGDLAGSPNAPAVSEAAEATGPGVPDIDVQRSSRPEHQAAVAPSMSFLNGLSLFGISQLLNLEQKTCLVEATQANLRGSLTFQNGDLIDADTAGIVGEDAVERMLTWERPTVWIHEPATIGRISVTKSVTQLLLDAIRRVDERAYGGVRARMIELPTEVEPETDTLALADAPPVLTLPPSAADHLADLTGFKGVIAAAIVESATRTVLATSSTRPGFDLAATIAATGDAIAAQLDHASKGDAAAGSGVEEIRISERDTLHLVRPLGPDAYLFVSLDRAAGSPERAIRRIAKSLPTLQSLLTPAGSPETPNESPADHLESND